MKNRIILWAIICTLIGCLFASFQTAGANSEIIKIFVREIISVWFVGLVSLPVFYFLFFNWVEISYFKLAAKIIGVLILINIPMLGFQHYVIHLILDQPLEFVSYHNGLILLRGVVILIVIGNIAIRFEQLEFFNKQQKSKRDIKTASHKSLSDTRSLKVLQIKLDGQKIGVPLKDILYIQGDSYQSLVHTNSSVYSIRKTLKSLEKMLAAVNFQRIHKSYIVRLDSISHIKYYMGGRYLAYLKSIEKKTLPVGRTFAQALKKTLGLSR